MAVTLQCARCMHEQKIDDDKAENGVPCKICHHLIKSAANGVAKSKPSSAKAGKKDEGIKSGAPAPTADKQTAIASKKPKPPLDDERPRSKRRNDRDDDDDRGRRRNRGVKDDSSNMMFILLGVGAFLVLSLLCGGGLGAYMLMGGSEEKPIAKNDRVRDVEIQPAPIVIQINPGPIEIPNLNPAPLEIPINPGPNPFQQENLDPNNPANIERVIVLLKGPQQQRTPAYQWLRAANPVHPRRTEVAKLLDAIVPEELRNPFAFAGDFFPAFFRWATLDNVPTLKRMAENPAFNPSDNDRRQQSMITLGRLKEGSAAELIVSKLGNAFDGDAANKALTEMGPVAEPAVLKYFNARDGRDRARNLIKGYNTKSGAIVAQCITDLEAPDNDRRKNALQWFTSTPVEPKHRSEIARALVKRMNADAGNKFGSADLIRALGKVPDPEGAKAVAKSMTNFFNQGPAREALKEMGPLAEPAIVEAMNATADANARKVYVNTLGEMGTKQSIPAIQAIGARFPQQPFLANDVKQAIQSITLRGK